MATPTFEGHGLVGTREQAVSRLLAPRIVPYDMAKLVKLAESMESGDQLHDGPDAEENVLLPAGYTYLGQFVDHDLTFDTTSSLDPQNPGPPTNLRSPRFDLDCLYGAGPADQPYMYDGAKLRFGRTLDGAKDKDDLLRSGAPETALAVIGDKRNDENSIICQLQLAFIKFHNAVVEALDKGQSKAELFKQARNQVRWTYQRILIEDYLVRLIEPATYNAFARKWRESGEDAYKLYTWEKRFNIPIEFSGAAYRFGHSMIRQGYRLNRDTALDIFNSTTNVVESLIGFQPLPSSHVIDDWNRFFDQSTPGSRPERNAGTSTEKLDQPEVRLQYAYKIDSSIAGPLTVLPDSIATRAVLPPGLEVPHLSLQVLNLLRGNTFLLQSGQNFAEALGLDPLDPKYLRTRKETDKGFTFEPIDDAFLTDTPLWFYILAEAQRPVLDLWMARNDDLKEADFLHGDGASSQLGPVGGRILMEVFFGLLDADRESYRYAPIGWDPPIRQCRMWDLLKFARLAGT